MKVIIKYLILISLFGAITPLVPFVTNHNTEIIASADVVSQKVHAEHVHDEKVQHQKNQNSFNFWVIVSGLTLFCICVLGLVVLSDAGSGASAQFDPYDINDISSKAKNYQIKE